MTDFEKLLLDTVRESLNKGICEKLGGYNSPLNKLIDDAFKNYDTEFRTIVYEALGTTIKKAEFKKAVHEAFEHKIARSLVEHLTSTIDKAVNSIRQDPTIKARMVLAIESIIKENEK